MGPKRTLSEEVARQLRRAVIGGEFEGGAAIPEAQTAEKLGVSRVPVREALQVLAQDGLVEYGARGRAIVRCLSVEDFEEIYTLRLILEPAAAMRAAEHVGEADIEMLEELIGRQEAAGSLSELSFLDVEFHDRIMRLAKHERLLNCWLTIRHQLELWLARLHRRADELTHVAKEVSIEGHREFVGILNRGDVRAAGAFMHGHIAAWREWLPGRDEEEEEGD